MEKLPKIGIPLLVVGIIVLIIIDKSTSLILEVTLHVVGGPGTVEQWRAGSSGTVNGKMDTGILVKRA